MALDIDARQSMLAEPLVAILAIERHGHAPIAVPVWHAYEPGGTAWILMETSSEKARLLRAAGKATLVVDTVSPRTRYVSAACTLVEERRATRDDARVLAERYLGQDGAAAFLESTGADLEHEVVFVLQPVTWRSADLTV